MIFDDFGIDFPASPVPSLGQKLDSIPPCFSSQSLAQTQLPSQEKNRVGGMRRQPLNFSAENSDFLFSKENNEFLYLLGNIKIFYIFWRK